MSSFILEDFSSQSPLGSAALTEKRRIPDWCYHGYGHVYSPDVLVLTQETSDRIVAPSASCQQVEDTQRPTAASNVPDAGEDVAGGVTAPPAGGEDFSSSASLNRGKKNPSANVRFSVDGGGQAGGGPASVTANRSSCSHSWLGQRGAAGEPGSPEPPDGCGRPEGTSGSEEAGSGSGPGPSIRSFSSSSSSSMSPSANNNNRAEASTQAGGSSEQAWAYPQPSRLRTGRGSRRPGRRTAERKQRHVTA